MQTKIYDAFKFALSQTLLQPSLNYYTNFFVNPLLLFTQPLKSACC